VRIAPAGSGRVMSARRVAAIDVGTNTVLLLVAEGTAENPVPVLERATITRLGAGVDRTGRLSKEAMHRTALCLEEYRVLASERHATAVDVVCTSAARDAENGIEFLDLAAGVLGVTPRIIDGDEEGRLTFDGAITGLDLHGDALVFDIGGGSTEIIFGEASGTSARVHATTSLDVGSVRLTERHVRSDPPSSAELSAVRADIDRALSTVPRRSTSELVGVAGTVTTLSAIHQGLSVYDPAIVHGSRLSRQVVSEIGTRLAALPLEARRRVTGLEPGRADVIVAGAELVERVLAWAGMDSLRVSDRGVRWGLARALLRR